MKITAFGVRPDERQHFERWTNHTGDDIRQTAELLTPETLALAKGSQGITSFQTVPYAAGIFKAMRQHHIPWLALRNTGVDNVDFAAAEREGIRITNVPAYSPNAIAEFALADMLYLLRQTGLVQRDLQANHYQAATQHIGRELRTSTVGVIGTGRIGRSLITSLNGIGAKVLAFDPHPKTDTSLQYESVSFQTLLRHSDIVTLHVPGTPANAHLIDEAALALMKPGSLLINTGRPNLIDTTAVIRALQSGQLSGVGIDTFEHEADDLLALDQGGQFNDPQWQTLLAMPNVILSPHIAYYTDTAVRNMVECALQALHDLQDHQASNCEVYPEGMAKAE